MAVENCQTTHCVRMDDDSLHFPTAISLNLVDPKQPYRNSPEIATFQTLIERAKSGNEQAIGELYDASRQYLLLIANQDLHPQALQKFGASDVVQQSMIVASNKISEFRGSTRGEFLAWMRQILLNECRSSTRHYLGTEKRKANREQTAARSSKLQQSIHESIDPHLTPSTKAATDEQIELVRLAMQSLSPLDQQVIEMRNWQNLPFEQIGTAIGKSSEAARKIWSRAVLSLEKELRKMNAL